MLGSKSFGGRQGVRGFGDQDLCPMTKHAMGGCQNYGPFLGTLNHRCRIIIGTQNRTIILTTTLMSFGQCRVFLVLSCIHTSAQGNVQGFRHGWYFILGLRTAKVRALGPFSSMLAYTPEQQMLGFGVLEARNLASKSLSLKQSAKAEALG